MKRILITVGVIATILIITSFLPFAQPIRGWAARPFAFLGSSLYHARVAVGNAGSGLFCPRQTEVEELEAQIRRLAEENTRLATAASENETLRSQLSFFKERPSKHVFAEIVGKAADSYASAFIINKGSRDGIRDNLAVVTDNGVIIGKTTDVQDTTSRIVLLNDRSSKLLVIIPNKKEATGIVEGQFGLGITMALIPITGEIVKDDIVVTAGLEEGIPPGLIVGSVASVQFQQGDLFKTAQIKSAVSYDSVRIVSVLLPE